jgi:hypothetical protein
MALRQGLENEQERGGAASFSALSSSNSADSPHWLDYTPKNEHPT